MVREAAKGLLRDTMCKTKRDVKHVPQEQAPVRTDLQGNCRLTDRLCSVPAPTSRRKG
jgi:hypothetical protein